MKLIHTADIHLDRSFSELGLPPEQGNAFRDHLRSVFRQILRRAGEDGVAALAITGDLFDGERITRDTVDFLHDSLSGARPLPVFICAGRVDAAVADSPYLTEHWPPNVHLFTTPAWRAVQLEDVPLTVHGFGWDRRDREAALPAGLEIPLDGRAHVAIGYGLAGKLVSGAAGSPLRLEPRPTLPSGLAYLGLGEHHTSVCVSEGESTPVWYAGAPEGGSFDERGPHYCVEVSLEEGGPGRAALVETSAGRLEAVRLDCGGFESGQALLDAARAAMPADRRERVVRLTLEGALALPVFEELDSIRETLSEEALYLQWRERCAAGAAYDAIAREPSSLGAFVARIGAEIGDAPDQALRRQRIRSRDLGLCAFREIPLPVRGLGGEGL
ncbi:MAG: metallophosphoesterase [Candidatus Hydrogenedentes bacterium]|nr:metallophosphoesterase [Candidatus Hydrogenedentota bacterium]